jgi:hypothetical protein
MSDAFRWRLIMLLAIRPQLQSAAKQLLDTTRALQ